MRPVGAGLVGGWRGVRISICVVVGEGELLGDVGTVLAVPQLGKQGGHLVCIKGWSPAQGAAKGGVGHVDARVDDCNDCPLTLLCDPVGAHHDLGAEVVGVLAGKPRCSDTTRCIGVRRVVHARLALNECRCDAGDRADGLQRSGGGLERNTL